MYKRQYNYILFKPSSTNGLTKSFRFLFESKKLIVESIENAFSKNPEIAIFCAGGEISKKWAPIFSKNGITVIDNSSAWRMDHQVPLVVPEINGSSIKKSNKIIANPNCSTIQMVLALKEIHKRFIIDRIVVSTYQSVTGTGAAAVKQMMDERNEIEN